MGTALFRVCVGVAAVGVWGGAAWGQWSVVSLHPAGADASRALDAGEGQQVGHVVIGGVNRAALWRGTAASWVDLSPGGAYSSVLGVGTRQVGSAIIGGVPRAGMWNGTAASWVELHPMQAGATQSDASGSDGAQQVGTVIMGSASRRASLWSGTAGSWVNLNPTGATESAAFAIHAGQQVGRASVGFVGRASLWTGSAASWVDLNPAGSVVSEAHGVYAGRQVGYARVGDADRASLWSGTAASWVNLHPAGAVSSWATDIHRDWQVGYARFGNREHASAWNGTAESWEDLSLALTGAWGDTRATGIWSDGSTLYVSGYGRNNTQNRIEALLWTRPISTQPRADWDGSACVDASDITAFLGDWFADRAASPAGTAADFDGDGVTDASDLTAFLTAWFAARAGGPGPGC